MKNKNKGFISVLTSVLILIVGLAGLYSYSKNLEKKLGASVPTIVAWFETTLASKITSSATSMTLTSGEDVAGNDLDGYMCFTIDEGTASQEFVCGTASSTAITSMIRGIDPIDGDLEVTALKKDHRRGASVKITDYPQIAIISRILNGDETIPNTLSYATDTATFTLNQEIINKKYADDLVIAGGTIGDWDNVGVYRLATTSQLTAGTATTTLGYYLIVPNLFFNQTSSATNLVPVTNTSGKLSQGFIDLTGNFVWTGTHAFASTTINNTLGVTGTSSFTGASAFSSNMTIGGNLDITGYLAVTSTSTLATTTFSIIPTLPASNPTSDNQAARKKYVDDTVALGSSDYASGTALVAYDPAIRSTIATDYTKLREFTLDKGGTIRIKFDMAETTGTASGQIYRNGGAVGTEQTRTGGYVTFSEDIAGWTKGDLLQLYVKTSNEIYTAYVRNLSLYSATTTTDLYPKYPIIMIE